MLGLFLVAMAVLALSVTWPIVAESESGVLTSLVKLLLGLLFLGFAIHYLGQRPAPGQEAKLPRWMAEIDSFTPLRALGLGALLSALNPKNLILNVAAVSLIAEAALPVALLLVTLVVFILAASIAIILPLTFYFLGGSRAKATLARWKAWLSANNAIVLSLLFFVLALNQLGSVLRTLLG